MSGVVTYTHCGDCRQRIPWGQPRYIEMHGYDVVREVCFGCVKTPRGRTGSAPRDTAPTSQATVHARGRSLGCRAKEPHFGSSSSSWPVPVRGDE